MLPAEIHNKIYDIVDTMNSFDIAEHNRKTENLMHQFSTCAYYTRGLEEEYTDDSVKPSRVAQFVQNVREYIRHLLQVCAVQTDPRVCDGAH